jgi:hypothetical protein
MILNNADIVTCPFCGEKKELLSLVTGNTFGSVLWSDRKQISPMLPKVSPVQKCPRCGKYYLYYKQPTQTADHESSATGDLSYEEWKEAFAQLNADPSLDNKDKTFIYMRLIQAFNDHYYRGKAPSITKESTPPQEEYAYIVQIIDLLISLKKWETPSTNLFKAELYREASHFSECEATLRAIDPYCLSDFERSIYSSILARATAHDHKVFICKS